MRRYTTEEVAQATAGGDGYIRTKDGVVRGLALNAADNPDCPEIIIVGKGPRIEKHARLLLDTRSAVPVFIKQTTNSWIHAGSYEPVRLATDAASIEQHRKHRPLADVYGILFMKAVAPDAEPINLQNFVLTRALSDRLLTVGNTKVIRHQDSRLQNLSPIATAQELYDLGLLDSYNRVYGKDILRGTRYIFVFVGQPDNKACFIGGYEVLSALPFSMADFDGYPYPRILEGGKVTYDLAPLPEFSRYKENMIIDWGNNPRQWHQWLSPKQIISCVETGVVPIAVPASITENFEEGRKREVVAKYIERNAKARARCLEIQGHHCKVCGIRMKDVYSILAKDLVHVHHIKPIAERAEVYQVDPEKDLIPVCPNCHAVIHATKDALDPEVLRRSLRPNGSPSVPFRDRDPADSVDAMRNEWESKPSPTPTP